MFQLIAYLKYLLNARGRHGTHSPFVYDFVDKCLTIAIPKEVANQYMQYRNALQKDDAIIEVTDLGAGSKKMGNQRKVSQIARYSSSSKKFGQLLYQLSQHYQPKQILELGTSLGIGTFMLAKGNPNGQVTTIDACPQTQARAKSALNSEKLTNITYVNDSFKNFLSTCQTTFDLIYIDGDHKGERLLELLNILAPLSKDETLFLLDDIRWTKEMHNSWQKIVGSTNYHLSMDLFRMGIIAKRKHQQKEHFIVKF